MSTTLQNIIAFVIVAVAATWLVWSAVRKRKQPGCGDQCGAVSPEVRRLQARLKR